MTIARSFVQTAEARRGLWALVAIIAVVSVYRIGSRELVDLGLHYDEAQYWVWSLDPAWGYFSKPPLVAWSIGLARALCGDGEACIRAPSIVALGVATLVVFALGRRLFDVRTGLIAALVFLLAPLTSFLSWIITTDSVLILFWALATAAFARAVDTDRGSWWVATGVAAGLGLLSKYTMGIFALSAAGFVLTAPAQRRLLARPGPYAGALVAALLFAPNVYWNLTHQLATFGHTAHIAAADDGPSVLNGLRFVAEQFGVFGPLSAIAFIAAAVRPAPPPPASGVRARRRAFALWFALPMLAIISAQALERAHANWAAPACVTASILAGAWLAQPGRRGWLIATLAFNLVAMAVLYHYRQVLPAAGVRLNLARDPVQSLQGWDTLGRAVAARLQATGARLLSDDRRLMSWLIYYARPAARDALTWNPERVVDNHYRLTRDVAHAPRGPFLFVSERERGAELARQFASVEALGTIRSGPPCAAPASGCARAMFAYRLGDFRGYDARAPAGDAGATMARDRSGA